jgi:hypothetical protein
LIDVITSLAYFSFVSFSPILMFNQTLGPSYVHDVTFAPNFIIIPMEKPLTKAKNVIISI